jgi:2-phospho-L-lactate/phosphoenolpyruvate guanylyltransferase
MRLSRWSNGAHAFITAGKPPAYDCAGGTHRVARPGNRSKGSRRGAPRPRGDNGQVQQPTPIDRWTVIVPLKSSARGKSRIDVDPALRRRLALSMALDTVEAASLAGAVRDVLAVVENPDDGDRLAEVARVRVVRTTTMGLNQAIAAGLAALRTAADGPIGVLPGDLPSLTSDELDLAFSVASTHRRAVVADKQGTGTTLLTAAGRPDLQPHYGAGSLRRHVAAGAVPIELPVDSGLRRDVDRAADLVGVTGARTLKLLVAAGLIPSLCEARPGR